MSLPWLADILSGLVYYFAGMLMARRERAGTAAGVWLWPEPSSAPAWSGHCPVLATARSDRDHRVACGRGGVGSFSAGGEYATQPRLAKAGLAITFLAALLILSMLGKQMIGKWSDSGFRWEYGVDRQGRVMVAPTS